MQSSYSFIAISLLALALYAAGVFIKRWRRKEIERNADDQVREVLANYIENRGGEGIQGELTAAKLAGHPVWFAAVMRDGSSQVWPYCEMLIYKTDMKGGYDWEINQPSNGECRGTGMESIVSCIDRARDHRPCIIYYEGVVCGYFRSTI